MRAAIGTAMARRLPALRPREMVRAFQRAGFTVDHQTGSHVILRHPETRRKVSVPRHNKDLRRGLMMALIHQAGLTPQEFAELL